MVLPHKPSVLAEVLHWLCAASRAIGEPRLGRSARLGGVASARNLRHPSCLGCYLSLGSEASEECRRGFGTKDRWGSDRIQGLVKEKKKKRQSAPAALGVARRARKVKAWPGTHSGSGSCLGMETCGVSNHKPPLIQFSPGSKDKPRYAASLLQHPTPPPPRTRPRAELPSLPGASHGERRRRGRRKDRRGGRSRGGLF